MDRKILGDSGRRRRSLSEEGPAWEGWKSRERTSCKLSSFWGREKLEKENSKGRGFLGQHGPREGQRKEEQHGRQGKDDREDVKCEIQRGDCVCDAAKEGGVMARWRDGQIKKETERGGGMGVALVVNVDFFFFLSALVSSRLHL